MAGQNPERRDVVRAMALAAAASQFPGFHRWAFAQQHGDAKIPQHETGPGSYRPRFFTAREYAIIERLTDIIIPSDDTPGAREAGVAEFIDFMVSQDSAVQYRFRFGTDWMDTHARWLHGSGFLELKPEHQVTMLQHLAYKEKHRPREEDGRRFFELMREYTVMGFYTSRVGMQQIDDPELRVHYDNMPGCPDPNAEDHRNHRYA